MSTDLRCGGVERVASFHFLVFRVHDLLFWLFVFAFYEVLLQDSPYKGFTLVAR